MYKLFLSIFFTISLSLLALESNEIKEVLPIHNENIGTEEETLVEEIVSIEEDKTLGCIINGVDRRNFYQCHFLIKKS